MNEESRQDPKSVKGAGPLSVAVVLTLLVVALASTAYAQENAYLPVIKQQDATEAQNTPAITATNPATAPTAASTPASTPAPTSTSTSTDLPASTATSIAMKGETVTATSPAPTATDTSTPTATATATATATSTTTAPQPGLPLGGSEGYGLWINSPSVSVSTKEELLEALNSVGAADSQLVTDVTIYVADDAEIDLTGTWEIPIAAGVTLASGRGKGGSLGALIHTDIEESRSLFVVQGGGVRITGLRIHGPSVILEPPGCGLKDATGISISADTITALDIEIDNNELLAWPSSAISVERVTGVHVHHNYIHHNRRQIHKESCEHLYGLGYGIVIGDGEVLIEGNLFDHNRHDIASDGTPDSRYDARYNLVLDGAVQHSFDMHPCRACPLRSDESQIAGHTILIHHNTFLQNEKPAVNIRGIPVNGAWIYENDFRHEPGAEAIRQINKGSATDFRLHEDDNRYGFRPAAAWFVSWGGEWFWHFRRFDGAPVDEIGLGDFDGDGTTDILQADGSHWSVARGGRGAWEEWNTSNVTLGNVGFGDFDGDGKTDLFHTDGSHWTISRGGDGPWEQWNASSVTLSNLGFGDFDGDNKSDVFRTDGAHWYLSRGGNGKWEQWNTSNVTLGNVGFGDFDGDGKTDVFRTDGSHWFISRRGNSPWEQWNTSNVTLGNVGFGDFDGDGKTDAFHTDGAHWYLSRGGNGPWEQWNTSSVLLGSLRFGDFNGDGVTDVLASRRPW